jgi:ankyrin repeat protein
MWQYKPPLPPLTWFAVTGRLEIAGLVLDHGANIEMPDLTGATAILYASKICHGLILQLLLDRGANLAFAYEYYPARVTIDQRMQTLFPSFAERLKKGVVVFAAAMWRNIKVEMRRRCLASCGGNSCLVMDQTAPDT